jgi:tetraacyldisaccharide 4'-kinase
MRAPEFWETDGLVPRLLSPLSALWAWGVERRLADADLYRPKVPVVCVGNLVTGGTGKTPVVLALIDLLRARGLKPHVLTRGYGGSEVGPLAVDPVRHDAARVGDEPLLLAGHAPTWVARWRPDGAVAAVEMGADMLVLDDGFQNASIAKDLSLVVVDGGYGFGNGRVLPAGPCRERVESGLSRADAVVLVGKDTSGVSQRLAGLPVLKARLEPGHEAMALTGRRVFAFAGIGRPEKFFATLEAIGAEVVEAVSFADHYPYDQSDIDRLLTEAETLRAIPVTTAKDAARIPEAVRPYVRVLPVTLVWDDPEAPAALLERLL